VNRTITTGGAENTERDKLTHAVIGCAIEVHKTLGVGLLESAYEAGLAYELAEQGIQFERQKPIFEAQLLTYMKLAHIHKGLLINFNSRWLKDGIKRMVLS